MANRLNSTARRRPVFIADFRTPEGDPTDGTLTQATKNSTGHTSSSSGITVGDVRDLDGLPDGEAGASRLRIVRDGVRYNFPPAGQVAEGGHSDGYCYRIPFAAGRLDRTYALVIAFLKEQGYGDLPLPADVEELKRFRLPPKLRHQLSLFGEDGYVHNPVKILFPGHSVGKRGALLLELYNEETPGHLVKFHRR